MASRRFGGLASRLASRPGFASSPRRAPAAYPTLNRSYAEDAGNVGQGANISQAPPTDPDSKDVTSARSKEGKTPDNAAASRTPVSQDMHAGQQDDPQAQSDNVKRPPEEPDHVKRAHVEKEGQKPLDPADTGYGVSDGSKGS